MDQCRPLDFRLPPAFQLGLERRKLLARLRIGVGARLPALCHGAVDRRIRLCQVELPVELRRVLTHLLKLDTRNGHALLLDPGDHILHADPSVARGIQERLVLCLALACAERIVEQGQAARVDRVHYARELALCKRLVEYLSRAVQVQAALLYLLGELLLRLGDVHLPVELDGILAHFYHVQRSDADALAFDEVDHILHADLAVAVNIQCRVVILVALQRTKRRVEGPKPTGVDRVQDARCLSLCEVLVEYLRCPCQVELPRLYLARQGLLRFLDADAALLDA